MLVMPDDTPDKDDDFLDGCDLDFAEHAVTSREEEELLPLFPQGLDTPDLDAKADEWKQVLGDA